MLPNRYVLAGLFAALIAIGAGAFWGGIQWQQGRDAKHIAAQQEAARKLDQARQAAEQARNQAARKLEDAANASPVVVSRCLSPERVKRLNGR